MVLATSAVLADYQKTLLGGVGSHRLETTDFQNMDLVIPFSDLPRYEQLARGHNTRETTAWQAEREHNARQIWAHINDVEVLFDEKPLDDIGKSKEYGAGLTLSIVRPKDAIVDCSSASERSALEVALMLKKHFEDKREVIVAYCDRFDRQIAYFCKKHDLKTVRIEQPRFASRYQGVVDAFCDVDAFEQASEQGDFVIPLSAFSIYDEQGEKYPLGNMTVNEYVIVRHPISTNSTLLGRYNGKDVEVILQPAQVFGVTPSGVRQRFMVDAVMNKPQNKMVLVEGLGGTGKTLMAFACAFQLRRELQREGELQRIYYFKTNTEVASKEGYLPGTQEQKCDHYFRGAYQVIARIADIRKDEDGVGKAMSADPVDAGRALAQSEGGSYSVVMDTINDERGTTYDNAIVIIDEAQNFTPNQLRSMMSRIGRSSLVIVLGDISQIDGDVNGYHNGLTQAMSHLRGAPDVTILRLLEHGMVKRGSIAATVAARWPYA